MTRFWSLLLLAVLACPSCAALRAVLDPHEDSLSAQEHLDLGRAYEAEGNPERAVIQYGQAAEEIPQAWIFLGNANYSLGRYDQAEDAFRQAVEALPDNGEARNNLAWVIYERGGDLEEAETLARQALALAPPGSEAAYRDTLDTIVKAKNKP